MILTLTDQQWADVERINACVVPGVRCECVGAHEQGRCMAAWPERPDDVHYPPPQFRVANEPCRTCDGAATVHVDQFGARYGNLIAEAMLSVVHDEPCPDCRDGKPVVELRVPCQQPACVRGRAEMGMTTCFANCIHTGTPEIGSVVVARATVTLLPVKPWASHIDTPEGEWIVVGSRGRLNLQTCDGYHLTTRPLGYSLDLLPVAGRDWVAVFEVIE